MSKMNDFLTEAGVFFLATVDGDQPKLRPLGAHVELDGKVIFGVGDFKNVYKDFELISEEETVLDGAAATKFVFTGSLVHENENGGAEDKETFKFMQVAAVKSKTLSAPEVYVITYTSSPEVYDDHIEEVGKMIDEFRFN